MGLNPGVAAQLAKIREALSEDDYEPLPSEANPQPGELGAPNADPTAERLDAYLTTIVDSITDEYDADEEEAFEFILSVADTMASLGEMPELPHETAPSAEQAEWFGVATTIGFHQVVLEMAAESAAEE